MIEFEQTKLSRLIEGLEEEKAFDDQEKDIQIRQIESILDAGRNSGKIHFKQVLEVFPELKTDQEQILIMADQLEEEGIELVGTSDFLT